MRLVIERRPPRISDFYQRSMMYPRDKRKYKPRDPRFIIGNADDLDETFEGKGIDSLLNESTECKPISYWVDKPDIVCSMECKPMLDKLEKESSMETISNYSKETPMDEDKESIVDYEEMKKKPKEIQTSGVKRKYSPSVIDFLVNNNSGDSVVPTPSRLQSLDSSMSDIDDFDTQLSKQSKERKNHCSLIKIPPKKRKRYPQKICVHCRQNHGVRKDTRYICTLCDVALCKEPCFAEYHCNK